MFARILAALLGVYHGGNGLYMLLAPDHWFRTGGIASTGPYNSHFVQDVGVAFLSGGLAFLVLAWDQRAGLLALGASGFLLGHAILHLIGLGHGHGSPVEAAMIAIPALIGAAIAWPGKRRAADA